MVVTAVLLFSINVFEAARRSAKKMAERDFILTAAP